MIYLTTAHNDRDLFKHFQGMAINCPIPFGDFIFKGVWEEWSPISVCGERKHLPDLLKCIQDNRHLEQIRGAREAGFKQVFLVVEDEFRETTDGDVELRKRGKWLRQGFSHSRLESYLSQLEYYAGIRVHITRDARETAHRVINLYRMFQKPPEEHSSLEGFHQPPNPVSLNGRPGLMRRVFKELHGIGWERSKRAEDYFKGRLSLVDALRAGEEWQNIEGIGPEISKMIYKEATER